MKRGTGVGGLVGPFSDGHTQVSGWVRWPAATHHGHRAAAAPFWVFFWGLAPFLGSEMPQGWLGEGGRSL